MTFGIPKNFIWTWLSLGIRRKVERGSGLYCYEYLRQMEALVLVQRVDSNVQKRGMRILQVGITV